MRIVLDTDVIVAAMRSNTGASFALIEAARKGWVKLAATVSLCIEYESACYRCEHAAAAELSQSEIDLFLDAIIDPIEPVEVFFLWRPQLRDPGDELVLEAAVSAGVNAIVTFNIRDYRPAAALFDIEVIRPNEAIRRLRENRE